MGVEGGIRHLVTGETGLAVGVTVARDEPLQPGQLAAAALGVAGAAILDLPVRARQWTRHQELHVVGENDDKDRADDCCDRHVLCDAIAPRDRTSWSLFRRRSGRSDPPRSPHHHHAVAENA